MKEKILDFISYFHLYDLILFAAFALIAMCFVFLSFISFRKKFISIPLFLLGFCMIIAIPFAMRYFMEERFYKIEQDVIYDRTYNYSNVYQYIADITNVGKRNIAGCVFSHQILYDTKNAQGITKYKYMLLNHVKPKNIYSKDIPMDLKVGQSVRISQVMEDYAHKGENYVTKIECYGKPRKHDENTKILQGVYKAKEEKGEDGEEKEGTQAADDAGKDDMVAYTEEMQKQERDTHAKKQDAKQTATLQSEEKKQNLSTPQAQTMQNIQKSQITQEKSNPESEKEAALKEIEGAYNSESKQQNKEAQTQNNDEKLRQAPRHPQGIPRTEFLTPPTEESLPPNWREERDRFSPPLLKENPR